MTIARRLPLAVVLLAALAPAADAATPRVPVPPLARGLRAEYDALRLSDFAVRLPAFTAPAGKLPSVRAIVPAPGTPRPVGSTVRIVLAAVARGRSGHPRSVLVPAWRGMLLSDVVAWARTHGVRLVIRFSRLPAGTATGLLGNYEIIRQSVRAGRHARTLTVRAVPLLPVRYGACRFPWGAQIVARDGVAALALVGTTSDGTLEGCVAALGGVVPVASANVDEIWESGTSIESDTLAGTFAGVTLDDEGGKYDPTCTETVTVVNLVSGGATEPGTSDVCGIDSLVLNSSGDAAWHAVSASDANPALPFSDIACPSVSLCVATNPAGDVASTENPTAGAPAWTLTPSVGGSGIACASTGLCVAVNGLTVATSTDPAAGAWTERQLAGAALRQVSCPSSSLCVAVGGDTIATSTDPAGGAATWTVTTLSGTHDLYGVACPSVSLCLANDMDAPDVFTSTDPTGGATAWTVTTVPGERGLVGGIACPSVSLCVLGLLGGQVATTTDPAGSAWTVGSAGALLTRLSCPAVSECVSGAMGGLAWSANPTGGSGAWQNGSLGGTFAAVSCPSSTLCVAVADDGHIATSTDPLGGAATWTTQLVDPPCATGPGCTLEALVTDESGHTTTIDTAGPGPGNLIANLALNGNVLSWTHAGAPRQTTLP